MKLVLAAVVATCLLGISESRPTIDLNQPVGGIGGVQGPAAGARSIGTLGSGIWNPESSTPQTINSNTDSLVNNVEGTSNLYDNLLRNIIDELRELINTIVKLISVITGSEICETVKITIETIILSVVEVALNTVKALSGDLQFFNQFLLDVLRFPNALVPENTKDGQGTPISEIDQINIIDIISIMNNFTQYLSVESNSTNKVFNILGNIFNIWGMGYDSDGSNSDGSDSDGSDSDGSDSDGQNSCGCKCSPCANYCTCKACK
ncbi:uncharacterized protein LOC124366017 isoform X1 [Homalodisca vitripennis]|uniref:uncharacterized protein LOC124366017 isoform X1 n=1 Tax=Homalodisca vitripennis TaxID=197043 RepID=UPI001EECA24D|nr:uncharacterized protein LOC124366017 isoform X1 [Homalodisca vitripennis]